MCRARLFCIAGGCSKVEGLWRARLVADEVRTRLYVQKTGHALGITEARRLHGPLTRRDITRKILEQANSTNDRQLCEDHLGLLHPALRAATVSLLRARRDLHLAQTKRFARDVIFDLLLDTQFLAVPGRVRRPRARPPLRLRDERAHEVVRERAAHVVVALAANNVVACAESKGVRRRQDSSTA